MQASARHGTARLKYPVVLLAVTDRAMVNAPLCASIHSQREKARWILRGFKTSCRSRRGIVIGKTSQGTSSQLGWVSRATVHLSEYRARRAGITLQLTTWPQSPALLAGQLMLIKNQCVGSRPGYAAHPLGVDPIARATPVFPPVAQAIFRDRHGRSPPLVGRHARSPAPGLMGPDNPPGATTHSAS